MKKFAMIATMLSALAAPASAQDQASASQGFGAPVTLPADVAARVAELRAHGDRFAAAIRLIEQEAMKPAWAGTDCDHDGADLLAALPES